MLKRNFMKMKSNRRRLISFFTVLCMVLGMTFLPLVQVEAAGRIFYVDGTNGSDTNNGTSLQSAFKTIQRAANVATAGDTVYIRGGTYRETVAPANSGTAGNVITFENYNSEAVTISGTDKVSGWTQYSGNIYRANLSWSLGDENQVFMVSGSTITPYWEARWPNTTEYTLLGLRNSTASVDQGSANTITDADLTQPDNFWTGGTVWCRGGFGWLAQTSKITGFNSAAHTMTIGAFGGGEYPCAGSNYYITGVLGALDSAKEWYIDSSSGKIYLQAPGGGVPSNVEVKKRLKAFDLRDKSYIQIKGIKIFAANIDMNNTNDCTIDRITAEYIYSSINSDGYIPANQLNNGINVSGNNNEIKNSTIAYSSGTLIKIAGNRNKIVNNYLHDANYMGSYMGVINLASGNENLISNNTMCQSGRYILYWQNGNANIQYNNMYDFMWLSGDGGALYCWGADMGNSEIHHNIVHGSRAYHLGVGVYLDNFTENAIVHHNVIYDVDYGFKINSPNNYCLYYNNTADCSTGLAYWGESPYGEENYGDRFFNNIFTGSAAYTNDCEYGYNINAAVSDFQNAAAGNYRLVSGAASRDAGTPIPGVTDQYAGAGPDCGAYEYNGMDWSAGHNFSNPPSPVFSKLNIKYMNRIQNPAFESGTAYWSKTEACLATTVQTVDSPAWLKRGYFFKLRLGGGTDGLEQTITGLSPNSSYKLSGWFYADSGETVEFGVKNYGGSTKKEVITNTQYVRKEIIFTTGQSNTSATIYILKSSGGQGYVYADDLGLTDINLRMTSKLEAESYDSMSGIINGGNCIGGCDNGDWVRYSNVDLGNGYGVFKTNVLNNYNPGQVEIRLDSLSGTLVGTLGVSSAGIKSTTLRGANGVHDIYIKFTGNNGVGDFDWFSFENSGIMLEAENYYSMSGIINGGNCIGGCDNGDWVRYNNVNLDTGYSIFEMSVLNNYNPGQVEVRLDSLNGTLVGTVGVSGAGIKSMALTGAAGVHDIYIKFTGNSGVGDFDWFSFLR